MASWISSALLVLGLASCGVSATSYLTPLADFIKKSSDPDVPPIQAKGSPVLVSISFALMNIVKLDEESSTVHSEGMTRIVWPSGITWDPAQYHGASHISLPKKYFWTPLMYPLGIAADLKDLGPNLVQLYSNGTAVLDSVYKTVGYCNIEEHAKGATCVNTMSYLAYCKEEVVLAHIFPDMSGRIPFFAGSRYIMVPQPGGIEIKDRNFAGRTYQEVVFKITIKEKPGHHHKHGPFKAFFQWH